MNPWPPESLAGRQEHVSDQRSERESWRERDEEEGRVKEKGGLMDGWRERCEGGVKTNAHFRLCSKGTVPLNSSELCVELQFISLSVAIKSLEMEEDNHVSSLCDTGILACLLQQK